MSQNVIRIINLCIIVGLLLFYQDHAILKKQLITAHEREERIAQDLTQEFARMGAATEEIDQPEKNPEETYKDGSYEGTGDGYGGAIKLRIDVKNGRITSAEVLEASGEDSLYLNLASELLQQMVELQTTDLDAVSGATYSSKGIMEAAKNALKGAQ